jgi:putative transposase
MRTYRRLCVRLTRTERKKLDDAMRGVQPARTVLRALALSHLNDGKSAREVAAMVRLTAKAVREIGRRYEAAGLEPALYDKARPGARPVLNDSQRQRIIAMVCSDPPEGRARWTVRLIAEEAIKRKLVPPVGRETIRILLLTHDLKPWREKNVGGGGTE